MKLDREALRTQRAAMGAPELPEEELVQVQALVEELAAGLARMPEVSAIDPAVRFAVPAGSPAEGE
jgi:hypothetical protein